MDSLFDVIVGISFIYTDAIISETPIYRAMLRDPHSDPHDSPDSFKHSPQSKSKLISFTVVLRETFNLAVNVNIT